MIALLRDDMKEPTRVTDEAPLVVTRLPYPERYICPLCGRSTMRPHTHHILPKEWGGVDVLSNRTKICAACHNDVHAYLDWLEARGGELLPWPLRRQWRYEVRELAIEGWRRYQEAYTP